MIVVRIGNDGARAYAVPQGYSPPVAALARSVPGCVWNRDSRRWEGYPDAVAAFARAAEKAKLATCLGQIVDQPEIPVTIPKEISTDPKNWESAPRLTVRDYQVEGVKFLCSNAVDGAMLAWDVGLGKTSAALLSARALIERGAQPVVVVVCPAVVKGVWEAEAKKWCGDYFETFVLYGTKQDELIEERSTCFRSGRPALIVVNYDIVYAQLHAITPVIGVVVLDECHYLLNERARRSIAVKELASVVQYRIALSATPMTTRPRDLWNPIDTISPGRFGKGPWPYLRRYANAHKETIAKHTTVWVTTGSSHEDELAFRLPWVMQRKTKAEVMTELPARTRQSISIKVPERAIMPIWKEGWGKTRRDTLGRALSLSGTGKIKEAVELTTSRVDEGHSVVVVSHLRETAAKIAKSLKVGAVFLATGETPSKERIKLIADAKKVAAKKPVVIVATIDAVGVGVDLSFADVMVFVDLDWVPSKLLQMEGRCHRHGQKNPVVIYYLIGVGTADEYIKKKVIERLHLYDVVLGGGEEATELSSDLGDELDRMTEDEVLADLRRAVMAGEVVFEEEEALA